MQWVNSHLAEKEFHDAKAVSGTDDPVYGLGALEMVDRHAYHLLGDLEGATALDVGCGAGHHAVKLAERGARVYAVDLSAGMVEVARRRVKRAGLEDRVTVMEMSAEGLEFADETFYVVFGHSVLHHTDLGSTRYQVYRVLRRGGRGIFVEPLAHSPALKLFRRLTPGRRTATEQPLTWGQLQFFAQPFSSFVHREFYLLALAAFATAPLRSRRLFQAAAGGLSVLDVVLFRYFPWLQRLGWVTVFEVVK
ncbi:MAG: class I SAM-dependent methyltransferase [Moorellales bacterium]